VKRVVLGVPCVRRLDLLQDLYRSAALATRPPDVFAIVDNGADVRTVFNAEANASIPFSVFNYDNTEQRNLGVSASWNLLFDLYPKCHIVISNDDVRLQDNTIAEMVKAAEETDAEFVFPKTETHTTFCVFLLKREAWLRVGRFDEGFWPAYYEDIDYWHRMRHAGVKMLEIETTCYDHVLNGYLKSMTPEENKVFHGYMQANYRRYVRKWGGAPGSETRTTPLELP
jgi:GT2 family glycosyltransferase